MKVTTENQKKIQEGGLESVGIYNGVYAGKVADNNDRLLAFRLKVEVPEIFGEGVASDWAMPRGVYAGKGYGIFALPQKGDNVWVSFQNGDARFPLWEYGAVAKDEKPTIAQGKTIAIISPKGNKIVLHETGKVEISNGTDSLRQCLDDLFEWIETAKVMTPAGLGTFAPDSITALSPIKSKFQNLLQ